jgi:hypothetical protein
LLTIGLAAQATTPSEPTVGRGFGFVYDRTREVALVGTVKGFISQSAAGSPLGLHLLVLSSGKLLDAHLGPYLSEQNGLALHAGDLVQIVGVNDNVHGKNVLLARQLAFHGRLVTVRNERGFLVRNVGPSRKIRNGKPTGNGGIQ